MNRSTQPLLSGARAKAGEVANAEEGEFPLVLVGDELAAEIAAQLEPVGDAFERAEREAHGLGERLERF